MALGYSFVGPEDWGVETPSAWSCCPRFTRSRRRDCARLAGLRRHRDEQLVLALLEALFEPGGRERRYSEAMAVLAWAVGAGNFSPPEKQVDPRVVVDSIGFLQPKQHTSPSNTPRF